MNIGLNIWSRPVLWVNMLADFRHFSNQPISIIFLARPPIFHWWICQCLPVIGKTTTKSEKLWPTHFSYHSIQWWLLSFFRTITEFFERILPKKIRWLTPPGIAGVVLCRERAVPSLWSEVRRKGTTQWRDLGESSPNWAYRMNRFF
jgi:hypothetical protein